ncbi:MAG TPA: 30S ribosomal protein S6 [Polyangiaceae bacterium]|nr:30S ribosomal protein S6 [Polyangiaceae bacterium]
MATAQILKSKEYETIYVLRPDVDADAADKVQNRMTEVVARDGGTLLKVEAWGRRKLAYPVKKHQKGVYVYVKYVGKGGLVQEIERNLKLMDAVLKYQTVLLTSDVDAASFTVDPEEIKFARLELPAEEEEKESRERALGLVDFHDTPRRDHREFEDEDDAAEAPEKKAEEEAN